MLAASIASTDDKTQRQIREEAEAVEPILRRVRDGEVELDSLRGRRMLFWRPTGFAVSGLRKASTP